MTNLKRFVLCPVIGHDWLRIAYPVGSDGESGGTFLRCRRCDLEDHDAGTVARGAGGFA